MDMDEKTIKAAWQHVLVCIQAAQVIEKPFAHIVVPEVFPADFYNQMTKRLPDNTAYAFGAERGSPEGPERERGVIDFFNAEQMDTFTGNHALFWKSMTGHMPTREMAGCLLAKFQPWLDIPKLTKWFGLEMNVVGKWMLTRDRAGYALAPHNDTWMKIVAGLFYLPTPGFENDMGTVLLKAAPDRKPKIDESLRGRMEDFHIARALPYSANTMFSFARTEDSFHCVQPLDASVIQRDILAFNVVGARGRFAGEQAYPAAIRPGAGKSQPG